MPYAPQNADKAREYKRRWYQKNKERVKTEAKAWQKDNAHRVRARKSAYRARKKGSEPAWLTPQHRAEMAEIYRKSREITLETGVLHVVDHIIPLSGKGVCGLHVPWNLQILTDIANKQKSNSH